MKLNELPVEADRIDLKKIQRLMDHLNGEIKLIATGEEWQPGKPGKTEGLKIHLTTEAPFSCNFDMKAEDGKELTKESVLYEDGLPTTQLYGKQASVELRIGMESLGLNDTTQLQENFYWYRLRNTGQGYDRLVPFKVVED